MRIDYAIAQEIGTRHPTETDDLAVCLGAEMLHRGQKVKEHSLSCSHSGLLFTLCDGGSENEKAFECAESCNSEFATLLSQVENVSLLDEEQASNKLAEGLKRANELLLQLTETEACEMVSSMGAFWLCKQYAIYSHVGNVRIYRYVDQVMELLTDDHTEAWELVKQGKITPEKIVNYPGNKVFTQLLGGKGKSHSTPTVKQTKVESGDCFILCSDGVSHFLNDREMEGILQKNTDAESGKLAPETAFSVCDAAFQKSEGKEHASVVIVQVYPLTSRWSEMIKGL